MPEVIINGPEGRIEGRYQESRVPNAPVALVLHPHPEHGGTMNSKTSYALFRCFADRGFNTMRFNFRGVGKSEGCFDQGEGELNDAASVLDWLQKQNPDATSFWIGGFSFGAWIAMQLLMRRPELDGFVTISPPSNKYDFSFLAPCPVSGLVLQGASDEVVPREAVDKLVSKLALQRGIHIDYRVTEKADHFYTGKIPQLMAEINGYLDGVFAPVVQKIPA